jgi:hypothetical protein
VLNRCVPVDVKAGKLIVLKDFFLKKPIPCRPAIDM